MSRYTAGRAKVNRRMGTLIYESSGAARAFDRRADKIPGGGGGSNVRRGKLSTYGQSNLEKQKIKHYYGLGERQLRRLFDIARAQTGNTGENLVRLCELRMDNVVRRSGLTTTRPQARQGIAHGHFLVNGIKCDVPSRTLRPGDVLMVKNREGLRNLYAAASSSQSGAAPEWITADTATMTVTVMRVPGPDEFSLPVEIGMVVELLSR